MTPRCPCGLDKPRDACCGRFLSGAAHPETAAELMRSRYTAYVEGAVDYIMATTAAAARTAIDRAQLADYCQGLRGLALKLVECVAGGPNDARGVVEFRARLELRGRAFTQRERSRFVREDGRWVYEGGEVR